MVVLGEFPDQRVLALAAKHLILTLSLVNIFVLSIMIKLLNKKENTYVRSWLKCGTC
jgi:hypothetical protein